MGTLKRIDAATLRRAITGTGELALLDVREALSFGESHILYASSIPLSRLEFLAPVRLARRDVPIVLCDAGEGLAARAAERLLGFGYTDVAVLDGGIEAWAAAGFVLFSGVNVPSKAFGEHIEHACDTPSISADELKQMMEAPADMIVLDSRPMDEYHAHNIPTGVCVPGAELAYRVHDLVGSAETQVVVNCAGRTRSIIGAQSLINAGIPNPVVALRNGTMGWHLAENGLETGAGRTYAAISERGLSAAKRSAARVAKTYGVRYIDRAEFDDWQREREQRSVYVLDVRSAEEYAAGHLPGSRSAPGGQLVQETDVYALTLNARVVLIDDDGVRATMTAAWLEQMGGREVAVLEDALNRHDLEIGPERRTVLGLDEARCEELSPQELDRRLGDVTVIDLALSRHYKSGHIPGAVFAVRARLAGRLSGAAPDLVSQIELAGDIVLTCEDGRLSRLAAAELAPSTERRIFALRGGNQAWKKAGFTIETGGETMADDPDDVWLRPYDQVSGIEEAMNAYLTWEVALVEQIERDGTARWLTENR